MEPQLERLVMSTIASELERRAKAIGGKAWGVDKQKARIYCQMGRKDVSAYFSYPDAKYELDDKQWDEMTGLGAPRLCVYIEESDHPGDWYVAEKAKIRARLRGKNLALLAIDLGDDELASQFSEADEIEESLFEQLNAAMAEGKIDEAREAFAGRGVF